MTGETKQNSTIKGTESSEKVVQVAADSAGYQYCQNKKQTFQRTGKLDLETRALKGAG